MNPLLQNSINFMIKEGDRKDNFDIFIWIKTHTNSRRGEIQIKQFSHILSDMGRFSQICSNPYP